ncbi:sporulation integral membrane protein YtvI [Bacillus sp. Hm123]|uniref:sporulation integral membrane protein YtvI n=1 Tax=Bacillus sp. Hm123 TaxID=3450745 RepID=UPI003F42A5EE
MNPVNRDRLVRFFIVIVSTVLLFLALYYTAKVTYPFIIGFAIAFLMKPFIRFLENKAKFPRPAAVVTSIITMIALFAGIITLLIAEIVAGANYFAEVVPGHIDTMVKYFEGVFASQIIPFYERISGMFRTLGTDQQETILANIKNASETFASTAGDFLQNFFLKLPNLISWIPNFATVIIFSFLAAFFISKDWERLQQHFSTFLPNKASFSIIRVFSSLKQALFGYVKATMTLVSITTVTVLIGFLILKVNYAITLALIAGLVDVLPYLGTGAIFVPWIIYEFIAGDSGLAIGLTILYTIVVVQRQIIEPKVLSSSIGLDPLATLVALFIGFKLFGFFGLILGPVTLVILNSLRSAGVFSDLWQYIMGKDTPTPQK